MKQLKRKTIAILAIVLCATCVSTVIAAINWHMLLPSNTITVSTAYNMNLFTDVARTTPCTTVTFPAILELTSPIGTVIQSNIIYTNWNGYQSASQPFIIIGNNIPTGMNFQWQYSTNAGVTWTTIKPTDTPNYCTYVQNMWIRVDLVTTATLTMGQTFSGMTFDVQVTT